MRPQPPSLILAAAFLVAACSLAETPAPSTRTASPPAASATDAPASGSPSPARSAPATSRPPASATAKPASASPAGSGGAATACTGNDNNRTFFANSASEVAWDLYCAVLPAGWFVDVGSFRAASGGIVTVAYKTTTGLRLELAEGAICSGTAGECAPLDAALGSAAFGDRTGILGTHAGNLVLYVSPGLNPAWQATGVGLDEATFRAFCAALAKVAG